jgi:hypothetical protein
LRRCAGVPRFRIRAAGLHESWSTPSIRVNRLHAVANSLLSEPELSTVIVVERVLRCAGWRTGAGGFDTVALPTRSDAIADDTETRTLRGVKEKIESLFLESCSSVLEFRGATKSLRDAEAVNLLACSLYVDSELCNSAGGQSGEHEVIGIGPKHDKSEDQEGTVGT